jgi:hypothetical protein
MKLKFGMIVTDGANKLGGHVTSKNHYGRFSRTLVTPLKVTNPYTTAVRNNFAANIAAYSTITDAQRALWQAQTVNYPRMDNVGNIYYPTAQTLFNMINRNLATIGQAPVSIPPVKVVPPAPTLNNLTSLVITPIFQVNGLPVDNTGHNYTVAFGSRPLSPGINYVSTELRLLTFFLNAGQNVQNLSVSYAAKFGAIIAGQKVFCKLLTINDIGVASAPSIFSVIST